MASAIRVCCRSLFNFKSNTLCHIRSLQTHRICWQSPVNGAETHPKTESVQTPPENAKADNTSEAVKDASDTLLKAAEAEKKKVLEQLQEIQDKYKRSLAETENVRQRLQKQIEDAKIFGIQGFCKDLLEVADVLAKATESIPKAQIQSSSMSHDAAIQSLRDLFQGLVMTESQLVKVFGRHGLSKICPAEGEKFDPNFHEALFQQPLSTGKSPGTVAIVSKVGYKLHNRTLRPALVGVFASS